MKILTVADFFYPDVVGGSAVMAYQLMAELVRRGHQVTVLTRAWGASGEESNEAGIRVLRYKMTARQVFYPVAVIRCMRAVRRILKEEQYDLINMHHASGGVAAEMVKAGISKMPSVFFFQGPWHGEAMARDGLPYASGAGRPRLAAKYRLRQEADRYILRHCDAVVSLSDYMYREAAEIHSDLDDRWVKLSGGVDIRRFIPTEDKVGVRDRLQLPADKVLLLTVRRLDPRMGLENLIEAMALVEAECDEIVLLVGGKGEMEAELARLIEVRGLQNVKMLGFIPDDLLAQYFQASDLFIMPSVTLEGYGLVTLEALACGVPVLGSGSGATPEILEEILPDFILPDLRPESIAAKILAIVPQLKQRGKRETEILRGFAERHAWERVTDRVEALFHRLVSDAALKLPSDRLAVEPQ